MKRILFVVLTLLVAGQFSLAQEPRRMMTMEEAVLGTGTLSYIQIEMKKGSTLQLSGILSDSTTGKVTWSTSKSSVATVSSGGKVTAKGKGNAVITAKYGSTSLSIYIKVTA